MPDFIIMQATPVTVAVHARTQRAQRLIYEDPVTIRPDSVMELTAIAAQAFVELLDEAHYSYAVVSAPTPTRQ